MYINWQEGARAFFRLAQEGDEQAIDDLYFIIECDWEDNYQGTQGIQGGMI